MNGGISPMEINFGHGLVMRKQQFMEELDSLIFK